MQFNKSSYILYSPMIKTLFYLIFIFSVIINPLYAQTAQEYMALGDIYYKEFKNPEALAEYKSAYELDQDSFEILKRLTLTSNDCGEDLRDTDMEKAKMHFRESVAYAELANSKFPNVPETHFLLAISYGNLARYSKGKDKVKLARNVEENLQKIIRLKPEFAPSYIALGIYYRQVSNLSWFQKKFANSFLGGLPDGTIEDSRDSLLKAIELDPDFIITHYEIGRTYREIGDYGKAKYHFQKVLELDIRDHSDYSKKDKVKLILDSDKFKAELD